MWATLDAFEWPEGYEKAWADLARYYAEHPDECREMVSLEERAAALARLPEDSPEVERLAEDWARHFEASFLPEELSRGPDWMPEPLGYVLSELMQASMSPAQRRFVRLLGKHLSEKGSA